MRNMTFHLAAGIIGNLIFWAVLGSMHRILGLLIVWYYSYEFIWRPLTKSSNHFTDFGKRSSSS